MKIEEINYFSLHLGDDISSTLDIMSVLRPSFVISGWITWFMLWISPLTPLAHICFQF